MIPRPIAWLTVAMVTLAITALLLVTPAAAQTEGTDAVATFEIWWLILGPAITLAYPWLVRAGAGKWFKFAASIACTIGVAAFTVYQSVGWDTNMVDFPFLVGVAAAFVGAVQFAYPIIDAMVRNATVDERGLNELPVYLPERGLGPGK